VSKNDDMRGKSIKFKFSRDIVRQAYLRQVLHIFLNFQYGWAPRFTTALMQCLALFHAAKDNDYLHDNSFDIVFLFRILKKKVFLS
jgi:glucose-6-phosphate-specific signal transduction histidine kinase